MSDPAPIKLMYLERQRARLGEAIDRALRGVLEHGSFILGPEVSELEERLTAYCSVRHAVTCGNGTDALELGLRALGVGAGDAVFVPAFTFVATAEAAVTVGATPVLVDVDADSFNLRADSLQAALDHADSLGLRPGAVVAVDLFGRPADYRAIHALARGRGMPVLADAAQSFGATAGNARVGSLAEVTTTSFFPSKPFGCLGDGGAVLTDRDDVAELVRSLRSHGMGASKYDNVRIGMNSRLDTLQAAVLIEKLAVLDDEIARRNAIADRYAAALREHVVIPTASPGVVPAWALYTVRSEHRDAIREALSGKAVGCAVYYDRPLQHQPAYAGFPASPSGLATSERLCREVLSLPMDPYLETAEVDRVCEIVCGAVARAAPAAKRAENA